MSTGDTSAAARHCDCGRSHSENRTPGTAKMMTEWHKGHRIDLLHDMTGWRARVTMDATTALFVSPRIAAQSARELIDEGLL